MSQKRNRSINWDEEEKQLLRVCLKDYSQVIENKSMHTTTIKAKAKAWDEVLKKFNELNSRTRTLNQLQIQWKGMKMSARKNVANFKRDSLKTGGGPKPSSPTNEDIEVVDLMNPGELITDVNMFDSDAVILNPVILLDEAKVVDVDQVSENKDDDAKLQHSNILRNTEADNDQNVFKTAAVIQIINEEPETDYSDTKISQTPSNKQKIGHGKNNLLNKVKTTPCSTGSFIHKRIPLKNKSCDYTTEILKHSKFLKDIEHKTLMEREDEKHAMEIKILEAKLKCADLEREILEIRRTREKAMLEKELKNISN